MPLSAGRSCDASRGYVWGKMGASSAPTLSTFIVVFLFPLHFNISHHPGRKGVAQCGHEAPGFLGQDRVCRSVVGVLQHVFCPRCGEGRDRVNSVMSQAVDLWIKFTRAGVWATKG